MIAISKIVNVSGSIQSHGADGNFLLICCIFLQVDKWKGTLIPTFHST